MTKRRTSKLEQRQTLMDLTKSLEDKLADAERLISSLRRENFRLQDALPPPSLGVYLFLEVDGSLAISLQTETSTRYSIKISEDEKGFKALLSILHARQGKLSRAFASDACPSQSRVDEMIREWSQKNKITPGNIIKAKDFQP